MSTKSGTKKSDMFAKLAAQQAQPPAPPLVGPPTDGTDTVAQHSHESAGTHAPATANTPSPPPVESTPPAQHMSAGTHVPADPSPSKGKIKGKRENPDYVQANAYLPKKLRRAVEKALIDLDDTDYSTLVEELLRQWLRSRGVSG